MAIFKNYNGTREELKSTPKQEGAVYFINDGSLHFDYVDKEGELNRSELLNTSNVLVVEGEGETSIQHKDTAARAFGDRSVALTSAIAGAKGYRYCAIDTTNRRIYLTANDNIANTDIVVIDAIDGGTTNQTITPDTSIDIRNHYAIKDVFTLKMRSYDLDAIGSIKEIYSNYIVYDDALANALEETRLAASKKSTPKTLTQEITTADTYADRYSFSVPKKAGNGVVTVSEDAFAVGVGTTAATGRYSFAAGRDNQAVGDTASVFGRGNTAGYQAFCAGENSKALNRNYTLGYGCTNEGVHTFLGGQNTMASPDASHGFAVGGSHKLQHPYCFAAGHNNYTTAPYQTLIGKAAITTDYDKEAYNIIFGVGNAFTRVKNEDGTITDTETGRRSNAFSVWVDGHATVGRDTTTSDNKLTVANKGYVDSQDTAIKTTLTEKIDQVNTRVANHETYVKDLKLPRTTYGYVENEDGTTTVQTGAIQQLGAKAKGSTSVALIGGSAVGNNSFSIGPSSEANGQWSFAIGHSAKANSHHCFAIGLGTKTPDPVSGNQNREQVVVGRYNKVLDGASSSGAANGARFIVGIGTGENTYNEDGTINKEYRKNGLVVWGNGQVDVAKLAVGVDNVATGSNAIAAGTQVEATAAQSFAQGQASKAIGQWCVALNHGTIAQGRDQTAIGRYNEALSAPTSFTDRVNGAIFMVGNGAGEGARSNSFVSWNDGRATIGKDPVEAMDVATKNYVDERISNIELPEPGPSGSTSDWDYVIDKLENFTTSKLSTMSGRVLVENVVTERGLSWEEVLKVTIPSTIDYIEFRGCQIHASVTGSTNTRIVGFTGYIFDHDLASGNMTSMLHQFKSVEFCSNVTTLDCNNVIHSTIAEAIRCKHLSDIKVKRTTPQMNDHAFLDCEIIDSVSLDLGAESSYYYIEFQNCSHISNVINKNPERVTFDYIDCTYVDGDTCDGYYSAADVGKVCAVNTSGEKSLLDINSLIARVAELESQLSGLTTLLNQLNDGGIE